jgi:hypothetical protein
MCFLPITCLIDTDRINPKSGVEAGSFSELAQGTVQVWPNVEFCDLSPIFDEDRMDWLFVAP